MNKKGLGTLILSIIHGIKEEATIAILHIVDTMAKLKVPILSTILIAIGLGLLLRYFTRKPQEKGKKQ